MSTTTSPGVPPVAARRRSPVEAVAGWSLVAAGIVVTAFFLVVRGEPRVDLALSGLVVLGAGVATLRRVPFAALLAIPLGLFMILFPALRRYYSFSLQRPDELVGLVFTVVAVILAGVVLVSGALAAVASWRPVRAVGTAAAAATGVVLGLAVAVGYALVVAAQAQPDQSDGLTDAEVAALPVVVMDDFRFTPDQLTAVVGEELAIRLVSEDVETYRFTIDQLDIDVIVPSGRTAVVRITPTEAGTLTFYSSEEGDEHRQLGMVGEITVAP